MRSISHHITPLVINSLGCGHTHTHTDDPHRINFKKPGGTPGLINENIIEAKVGIKSSRLY